MELSKEELTFALLSESHDVACQALSGILLQAIRTGNGKDWKKTVCGQFTFRMRSHVERCLEDKSLTDIYVICKLIRCNITDIAKFCGRRRLDPDEKERLSLQAQGIDTVRNWMFHGESVSVGELCNNVALLILILKSLRCEKEYLAKLSNLQRCAQLLHSPRKTPKASRELEFSSNIVARALIYSCLRTCERLFSNFFESSLNELEGGERDIPFWVKQIKGELCKRKDKNLIVKKEQYSGKKINRKIFVARLDNLLTVRNKLAHNEPLSTEEISKSLQNISDILSSLDLRLQETSFAMERVSRMETDEGRIYCIPIDLMKGLSPPSLAKEPERALRPSCANFVGRTQELQVIKSTLLAETQNSSEGRIVVISGPAGIGKSFLATEAAHVLRNAFPIQAWVSGSSETNLFQDIDSTPHLSAALGAHPHTNLTFDADTRCSWLTVVDGVQTPTVAAVYRKLLFTPNHAFIVTTRSSSVRAFLEKMVTSLTVLRLQPFSTSESWELYMKNMGKASTRISPQYACSVVAAIANILGNLPLCVNIYSSLLASSNKSKPDCTLPVSGSPSLQMHWESIEDHFRDRLHVRGLMGILEIAKNYLTDHPMAVFLLAKLCAVNSERTSWQIIAKTPEKMTWFTPRESWVSRLFFSFLGVTDYLFSESGQAVLESCRQCLEEFGLISWDDVTETVIMHRLTLTCLQNTLHSERLFLERLVAAVAGHHVGSPVIKTSTDTLSDLVKTELHLQVLYQCVFIILGKTMGTCLKSFSVEQRYNASKCLSSSIKTLNAQRIPSQQLTELQLLLNKALFDSDLEFNGLCPLYKQFSMKKFLEDRLSHYSHNELGPYDVKLQTSFDNPFRGSDSTERNNKLYMSSYIERGLREGSDLVSSRFPNYFLLVCFPPGHKSLRADTSTDSLRKWIINIKNNPYCARDILCTEQIQAWYLQVWISLTFTNKQDSTTKERVLLLIELFQHSQQAFRNLLEQNTTETPYTKNRILTDARLLCFFSCLELMAHLLMSEDRTGWAMKSLLCNFKVMEATFPYCADATYIIDNCGYFMEIIGWTAYSCSEYSFFFRHYSIVRNVSRRYKDVLNKRGVRLRFLNKNCEEGSLNICEEKLHSDVFGAFIDALSLLCDESRLSCSLGKFLTVLRLYLSGAGDTYYFKSVHTFNSACQWVICLCIILGEEAAGHTLPILIDLMENDSMSQVEKEIIERAIQTIGVTQNCGCCNIHRGVLEVKDSINIKEYLNAKKLALGSWRQLAQVELPDALTPMGRTVLQHILITVLMQLASQLINIYLNEYRCSSAEWFIKFRLQLAQSTESSFEVAAFGEEYIKFLRKRERWWEALEQCKLVEQTLAKYFGDDYIEWLPDAPDITPLRQDLEGKLQILLARGNSYGNNSLNPAMQIGASGDEHSEENFLITT